MGRGGEDGERGGGGGLAVVGEGAGDGGWVMTIAGYLRVDSLDASSHLG